MHGGGVGDHQLDRPDIHGDRDGAGPLLGPLAGELDDPFPVEVAHADLAEFALEHVERRHLRATRRPLDALHVLDVEIDQVAERLEPRDLRIRRCASPVDLQLGFEGPAPGVLAAQEGLTYIPALTSDLDTPGARAELGEAGHFRVRSVCTDSSKGREKRRGVA